MSTRPIRPIKRRIGEVAGTEASLAAAEQKLAAMRDLAARRTTVHLGMSDFGTSAGRLTESPDGD